MAVSITAFYAGILALIVIALAINVTVHRTKFGIPVGDGGNPHMLRMMRLHGNASEYVPLAIVLMVAYEINGRPHIALHVIGIALVAGRLLHASGMWRTPKPNLVRASGQTLTWLAIMALAALNLWQLA